MRKHLQIILLLCFCVPAFTQQNKNSSVNYGNNPSAGKYINTRGIKMYCEIYGKGEPLLLIHGNSGSINNFKYQIPYFSKYYKVLAVDSRAQGNAFLASSMATLRSQPQTQEIKNQLKVIHMMEIEPNIPSASLHNIKCPALIIGGDHDVILPAHTLEIFNNIARAYLWIVPASGHATLQRYHNEFNEKVHYFFAHPYIRPNWDDWDKE